MSLARTMRMALPRVMRSVVFKEPHKVQVEDRPVPTIQDPRDIVVKVTKSALCGSELHIFRGIETPIKRDYIMGHEFTGHVWKTGSDVKTVKEGDRIVSPFTVSCGRCWYCKHGFSSRCSEGLLLGSPKLDGAQAEYIRIPHADGTVVAAPPELRDDVLVLMADIFPTGYFATHNGFKNFPKDQVNDLTVAVIGCGPVGLCTIVNAEEFKPKHLLAIDSVPSRLELAKSLGAEPWNFLTDKEGLYKRVMDLTDGRGADLVIEVVGLSPALRMAFELLRPFGVISSVGVHNAEIPWTGNEAYGKNLTLQMGRCPVRSVFPEVLEVLKRKQHLLGFMADKIMPLSKAEEGYELFDQKKAQKVIFEANK